MVKTLLLFIFAAHVANAADQQECSSPGISTPEYIHLSCTSCDCAANFHGYVNGLNPKIHEVFSYNFALDHLYEQERRDEDERLAMHFELRFDIKVEGEMVAGGNRTTVYDEKDVTREIICSAGQDCEQTRLFSDEHNHYTAYYIMLSFKHPYIDSGLCTEDGKSTATGKEFLAHSLQGIVVIDFGKPCPDWSQTVALLFFWGVLLFNVAQCYCLCYKRKKSYDHSADGRLSSGYSLMGEGEAEMRHCNTPLELGLESVGSG